MSGPALAIVGGHVIDPASGLDGRATVIVRDGRIDTVSADCGSADAERTLDAEGLVVVPGLVDLHTHLYWGVSHYGIDPDERCLAHGVTTAVDAGSAGAQTFPGLRRYVIEAARARVLAYVNVSVLGMISAYAGELEDLRWVVPEDAAACASEHSDVVAGIKVRLGYQMAGPDPEPALLRARKAADLAELPLMVHVIDMLRPITWLLPHLEPGDVVTHCFHGNEGGVLDERGRVFPEVFVARDRGVIFDVGHGIGSFAWRVARIATEQGLWPATISSDVHAHNVDGPVFDQPTTLSKLLHLGMPLADVVRATTAAPAAAVRREDTLGSLAPGREADITLLEVVPGEWRLTDGAEESVVASSLIVPRWVVRAGETLACKTAGADLEAQAAVEPAPR